MEYKDKLITLQQALDLVQDGDYIVLGMAASDPIEFSTHLHEIAPRINEVTVSNCLVTFFTSNISITYPHQYIIQIIFKKDILI